MHYRRSIHQPEQQCRLKFINKIWPPKRWLNFKETNNPTMVNYVKIVLIVTWPPLFALLSDEKKKETKTVYNSCNIDVYSYYVFTLGYFLAHFTFYTSIIWNLFAFLTNFTKRSVDFAIYWSLTDLSQKIVRLLFPRLVCVVVRKACSNVSWL